MPRLSRLAARTTRRFPSLFDGSSVASDRPPTAAAEGVSSSGLTPEGADAASATESGVPVAIGELGRMGFVRVAEALEGAEPLALSRERLIDYVQTLNPTAPGEYLQGFDEATLLAYLERLLRLNEPRSGGSRWTRLSGSPAITCSPA